MRDKVVRNLLLGASPSIGPTIGTRVITIKFPPVDADDIERKLMYPTADGIILTLLKRIENLEDKISKYKK